MGDLPEGLAEGIRKGGTAFASALNGAIIGTFVDASFDALFGEMFGAFVDALAELANISFIGNKGRRRCDLDKTASQAGDLSSSILLVMFYDLCRK